MEWMVFEDLTNMALICLFLGIGAATFVGLMLCYVAVLSFLEN